MGETFHLKDAELRAALEDDSDDGVACIDVFATADDLQTLLADLQGAGIVEAPPGLEILVYASAVSESDVVLVTVFSHSRPDAHVVAGSQEMRKMVPRELWEGDHAVSRTVEIVDYLLDHGSRAVQAVRLLERSAEDVFGSACQCGAIEATRCPKCGAPDQLRVEYRYDVRGVGPDGELVFGPEGEMTDLFCLACCQEVDGVLIGGLQNRDSQIAGALAL